MDAIARSYTTRELPVEDWYRLKGTGLEVFAPYLSPECTRVLVVECDGDIIGTWSLLQLWHVEGLWIRPDHRKRGSVGRRLLATMRRWFTETGAKAVVTGAIDPNIEVLLTKARAIQLPGHTYVWPICESESKPCQQ